MSLVYDRRPAPLVVVDAGGRPVARSNDMPFEQFAVDIRRLIERLRRRPADAPAIAVTPLDAGTALRVAELAGFFQPFYAATLEHAERGRDPLHALAEEYGLTNREREVLDLIVAGCTDAEISERLFIARTTATDHTRNILRKTGTGTRAKLTARVLSYDSRRSDATPR